MEINELFEYKNWAVIGSVTKENKYAYKVKKALEKANFTTFGIYPTDKTGVSFKSLSDVTEKIDCIDLCINPKFGIDFIKEAKKLGIDKVLIQPGAESEEILTYCKENNITAIEGCALVQLRLIYNIDINEL